MFEVTQDIKGCFSLGVQWSCGHEGSIVFHNGIPSQEDIEWNIKDEAARKCPPCSVDEAMCPDMRWEAIK